MLSLQLPYMTIVIVVTLVHDSLSAPCDTDWVYKFGRCYRYYLGSASFDMAKSGCMAQGAIVASVNSAEEQNFLFTLKPADVGDYSIIGGQEKVEGVWLWADMMPVSVYTAWNLATGEPNDRSGLSCMQTWGSNGEKWDDLACSNGGRIGYFCQKPSNIPPARRYNAFKLRSKDKKSVKTPMSTHSVRSLSECASLCVNQDGCLSVNVCSGSSVCELLDADIADTLVAVVGCDHYYFQVQLLE